MGARRGGRFGGAGAVLTVAAAGLGLAGLAFAASLTVNGARLGAGSADVRCDPDGVTVVQAISGSNVASVVVGGIAPACAGGAVSVTVRNSTSSSSGGPVTVPAGGGTVTVALSSAVRLKDAHSVAVLVVGP